jgi:hypothetical protein
MYTRDEVGFCAVCHSAIERVMLLQGSSVAKTTTGMR